MTKKSCAILWLMLLTAVSASAQVRLDYLGRPVRIGGYADHDVENNLIGLSNMLDRTRYGPGAPQQLMWAPERAAYFSPYLNSYGQLYPYDGAYYFGGAGGSYYGPYDQYGRSTGRVSGWIRTLGGLASIGLLAAGKTNASLYTSHGVQTAGGIADLMQGRRPSYGHTMPPMPMGDPRMGTMGPVGQKTNGGTSFTVENKTKFAGELFDGNDHVGSLPPNQRAEVPAPRAGYRLVVLVPEAAGTVAQKAATVEPTETGWRFTNPVK